MKLLPSVLMLSTLFVGSAAAADIQLVNVDPPGQGLNDLTPLAPTGGNPGTTIGEQRRIVYQYAMDLWGAVLNSDVPIRVQASFAPLECTPGRTVLGQAGPVDAKTAAAGTPGVVYHIALANALDGKELGVAGRPHISSQFNASYGLTNPDGSPCSAGSGWYYGLDGKQPAGQINFLATVMHEIAHGLGFSGNYLSTTAAYNQKVFSNTSGKFWPQMGIFEQFLDSTGGEVVYAGDAVVAEAPLVLGPRREIQFTGALQLTVPAKRMGSADFGARVEPSNFIGPVAVVTSGTGEACEALPAGSLAGKIALVNRGDCEFAKKAFVVEQAGAIGAIIGNVASSNNPDTAPGMAAGSDPNVVPTIPTISLNLADADAVRGAEGDITVQLAEVLGAMAGADDAGRPFLFTPDPFQGGSSFSHYDTGLNPNALMEPAISSDLMPNVDLDLTPALFADIGWVRNTGNGRIGTCDTGVRAVVPGGIVIGANIQAQARVCLLQAKGGRASYLRCMTDHATALKSAKLIDNAQFSAIRTCAGKINPAE